MPQEIPTFFFSHARQDREMSGKYLEKFFEDLVARVAQYAGVDLKVQRVGTIDQEVLQGADWDRELSVPLGTDKAFVAILTPVYFNRENCGKELYGFLMRSQNLGVDSDGALTDVENILPIRWLSEEVYYGNTQRDSLIPAILRRINDTPADPGDDPDRTRAIERYRKKGMEGCVQVEPHYQELLRLFALRIRNLVTLPPAQNLSFSTLNNAFTYDWTAHLGAARSQAVAPQQPLETVEPRALQSVVAFYVTTRSFQVDPTQVSFADRLIAQPAPGVPTPADPSLTTLLAEVRIAALSEALNVFHAASEPVIPIESEPLVNRLESLNELGVLTALFLEEAVWPNAPAPSQSSAIIEDIIRSTRWTGPVILPSLGEPVANVDRLVQEHDLPSRVVALPASREDRVTALRRAFVDARGRMLTMSTGKPGVADTIPILKGVVPNKT